MLYISGVDFLTFKCYKLRDNNTEKDCKTLFGLSKLQTLLSEDQIRWKNN